jgi:hypothetical protein
MLEVSIQLNFACGAISFKLFDPGLSGKIVVALTSFQA